MNIKYIWNEYIIDNFRDEDWFGRLLLGSLLFMICIDMLVLIYGLILIVSK